MVRQMAPYYQEGPCVGGCAICWAIWKARNRACFDKKLIKNPTEIICHAGALMKFWAGLFAEVDREMLEEGVNAMMKIAMNILTSKRSKTSLAQDKQDMSDGDASGK